MSLAPVNLLADQPSPYLQQHRENPVHWRPWSDAALAEARELDRPVLLSIGYAACHWCHVMAHECFEDHDIAALMNRLFVNIKVDREARPDIDQIYMAALHAMGEQGGWPLTMFLTPAGEPFWGGTYFPPAPRYGRPGFPQILQAVNQAWRDKKAEITRSASALTRHVGERLSGTASQLGYDPSKFRTLAESIVGMVDPVLGGMKGAPKFPNAPFMETLWINWLKRGDHACRDAVLLSLRQMLNGAIYDHLGGGLSRYSTDDSWTVPHFEKMLYDNAQLIRLAGWAFAETGDDLFRLRIEETIGWIEREMVLPGGGFAASLDADSEGEEGRFYTWTEDEVRTVLGTDSSRFLAEYDMAKPPQWEGDPVIRRGDLNLSDDETTLSALRLRLLEARARRPRPARDDKVLTDWNGHAIASLAEASRLFGRTDWLELAEAAFRFALESNESGRLPHANLGGRCSFPGLSSDHAAMSLAAAGLFEATQRSEYKEHARDFCLALDRWYSDETQTGHFLTAADCTDVPLRIRGDVDDAMPSATAFVVAAWSKLAMLTGEAEIQQRAWTIAEAAFARAQAMPYGQVGIFNACEIAMAPHKLVMVEEPGERRFIPVANRFPDPRRTDIAVTVGYSEAKLVGEATADAQRAGAWLCRGMACLPPTGDPAELDRELRAHDEGA